MSERDAPVTAGRRGFGAGALIALAALLLVVAGAVALATSGGDEPPAERQRPKASATPDRTSTPEPTATATAEATATAAPEDQGNGNGKGKGKEGKGKEGKASVPGEDPQALQLESYNLNNAGRPAEALPYAEKAVDLCKGSTELYCAYALFEYARALRMTGDPEGAIEALEERKQRFPDNQPQAVEQELALAREAAAG